MSLGDPHGDPIDSRHVGGPAVDMSDRPAGVCDWLCIGDGVLGPAFIWACVAGCPTLLGPKCETCGRLVREGLRFCPGLSKCWKIGVGLEPGGPCRAFDAPNPRDDDLNCLRCGFPFERHEGR